MTTSSIDAIVIGASAGAVEALSLLLPALPADYPLPIIIVVHLPPDKKSVLATLLDAKCALSVKEAEDKEPITKGTVYFAPPDYHLQIETNKTLSLSIEEPVRYSRPSIDVLFETAADAYQDRVAGLILTGANADGAHGLKEIVSAGGIAIVQKPAEAYASTMPQAALIQCPDAHTLSLSDMAAFLKEGFSQ